MSRAVASPLPAARSKDGAAPRRWPAIRAAVVALVLIMTALVGFTTRGTTEPLDADAPADHFSAVRAAAAAAPVVSRPRPVGSAENAAAREYLFGQLQTMGFAVEQVDGLGARAGLRDGDVTNLTIAALTRNLVATRAGTDPTGTIVLATHIDSVAGSPGAADAGVGLAVILEAVRALGTEGQRNDLVVLLVDGEEDGMLGAQALLQQDQERATRFAEPVVVLNHEARGTTGRPMVTRWSGPMTEVMASMPRPEAESFTREMFRFIPNDTDFTEYDRAGWWGVDMAITGGSWAYHSPQDNPAQLDRSTLQHYGDMTLAMTRNLLGRDLGPMRSQQANTVSTTAPWGILEVPTVIIIVLAVLGVLGLLLAAGLLVRRRAVAVRGVLAGVGGGVAAVVLGGALAITAWSVTSGMRPDMLSATLNEPVVAWPFLAAEGMWAAGAVLISWAILGRWLNGAALAIGCALLAGLLAAALTIVSPALGGWLVLPVSMAVLGTIVVAVLPAETTGPRRLAGAVVRALAVAPVGWVMGSQVSGAVDFGMATSNGLLAMLVLMGLLVAAPLVVDLVRNDQGRVDQGHVDQGRMDQGTSRPRTKPRRLSRSGPVTGIIAFAVAIGLDGAGLLAQDGAGEPVQERMFAQVDPAAGTTMWSTTTGRSDWARGLDGVVADAAGMTAPDCVTTVEASAQGNRVRIESSSPRGTQRLTLTPAGGT
ncbi:MAG: M28 family peptidase, partial [Propionibacteriales bacterium]|nr:M28 family peptidase [Propionibacteriales bacterium]